MDSLAEMLDYHDCPVCGFGQFFEAPGEEGDGQADGERCPDRACARCGTAVFLDPMLIWPARDSRGQRAGAA